MRISIIHTKGIPFKAFLDNKKATAEYERLRDLDDYVDYSVIEMPVEDTSQPADTADAAGGGPRMKKSMKEVIDRLALQRAAREKARKEKEFWEDWGCPPPEGWNANPPESEDKR